MLPVFSKVCAFQWSVNACSIRLPCASYSTTAALLKVTHDIRSDLHKRIVGVLLLLDSSRVFDAVRNDILCVKLRSQFSFDLTAIGLLIEFSIWQSAGCLH